MIISVLVPSGKGSKRDCLRGKKNNEKQKRGPTQSNSKATNERVIFVLIVLISSLVRVQQNALIFKQNKMNNNKQTPKTIIKSKFSNQIHEIFESLLADREKKFNPELRKNATEVRISKMTNEDKINFLMKIVDVHSKTSLELTNYLQDKRNKKKTEKLRLERGVVPKKKTSLKEYLLSKGKQDLVFANRD